MHIAKVESNAALDILLETQRELSRPGSVDDVMQRFGLVDRVSVDQHIRMHVRLAGIP